jgi:hypothetical protein
MFIRLHRSFIKWLHAKGEEGVARWFENKWEGKSWMLCDIGYSMAGGNKGQEGSHQYRRRQQESQSAVLPFLACRVGGPGRRGGKGGGVGWATAGLFGDAMQRFGTGGAIQTLS